MNEKLSLYSITRAPRGGHRIMIQWKRKQFINKIQGVLDGARQYLVQSQGGDGIDDIDPAY